jgi:hypothetical protein
LAPSSGRPDWLERGCAAIFLPALLLVVVAVLVAVALVHAALVDGQSPSDLMQPCPSDDRRLGGPGYSARQHGRCPLDDLPATTTVRGRHGVGDAPSPASPSQPTP